MQLDTESTADVTVSIASGDSRVTIGGGASVTFTPLDWDTARRRLRW